MTPGTFFRNSRRVAWTASIAWMAVIFGLSSLHGSAVPGNGATFGHFFVYSILGALLLAAFLHETPDRQRAFALAVLAASLYGVTDELHQAFVPGRHPDVVDWGIDTIGALVGAAIMLKIAGRRE